MKNKKNCAQNMGFDFYGFFLYINQPSSMLTIGYLENTISIYLLKCNREFTFCKGLMCSVISFISYSKDGTIVFKGNFRPKNTEMKCSLFWNPKYGMLLDFVPESIG